MNIRSLSWHQICNAGKGIAIGWLSEIALNWLVKLTSSARWLELLNNSGPDLEVSCNSL